MILWFFQDNRITRESAQNKLVLRNWPKSFFFINRWIKRTPKKQRPLQHLNIFLRNEEIRFETKLHFWIWKERHCLHAWKSSTMWHQKKKTVVIITIINSNNNNFCCEICKIWAKRNRLSGSSAVEGKAVKPTQFLFLIWGWQYQMKF